MADGRPSSSHGGFDTDSFRGTQVEDAEDVQRKPPSRPSSSRPKSGHKKRSSMSEDHDSYYRLVQSYDGVDGHPVLSRESSMHSVDQAPSPSPFVGLPLRKKIENTIHNSSSLTPRSSRNTLSQQLSSDHQRPASRQFYEAQQRPVSRQLPSDQERPSSHQFYEAQQRPVSRQSSSDQERLASHQFYEAQQRPVSRQLPSDQERSASRQFYKAQQRPVSRQSSSDQERSASRQFYKAQQRPVSRQLPSDQERPSSHQFYKAQQRPVSRQSSSDQERLASHQFYEAQQRPVSRQLPSDQERPSSRQFYKAQQRPVSRQFPSDQERSASPQFYEAQQRPVSRQLPSDQERPSSHQFYKAQQRPVSRQLPSDQERSASRQFYEAQQRPVSQQFSDDQRRPSSRQLSGYQQRPESGYAMRIGTLESRPAPLNQHYSHLPSIGSPITFPNTWNVDHIESQPSDNIPPQQLDSQPHRNSLPSSNRISSAISDISVISSKASTTSRRTHEESVANPHIERLDLTELNKPVESGRRKKSSVNHSSPAHRQKSATSVESKYDSGELYDGDDDDSDSYPSDSKESKDNNSGQVPQMSSKEPVIIPSENGPCPFGTDQDILLVVELPTDRTKHQRNFQRFESLMAILEFAEERAGQDFAGYILVSSPPRATYESLMQTISQAGLQDKTLLLLEERD